MTSPATDGIIDTIGRFSVTVDGVAVRGDELLIGSEYAPGPRMAVSVAPAQPPPYTHGQTVVVTYTDQTAGDDSNVVEDAAGNEVATFTTGVGGVPAVVNNSRSGGVVGHHVPDAVKRLGERGGQRDHPHLQREHIRHRR